ncbi:MAG: Fe-S protein assembly co-chaperone HscB [Pseudomonadota bacterium]|nr:Fe-S protein assembly co-chaperone HscB [Pseudomonadota bacterium]
MPIDSDDFELFAIERRFAQSRAALDARWRELQAEVHPDRFAAEGAASQRVAMQWSMRINEAYERLKDPSKRAAYLCELNGAPIEAENNTAMPSDFLLQQLEWREALDEAVSLASVEALAVAVADYRQTALQRLEDLLDEKRDYSAASLQVRSLMFVERFAHDVDRRLEALGQ